MGAILDQEQPDLVILTGDIVSGYAWNGKTDDFVASKWREVVQPMVDRGIYWATTAGNHDDQGDLNRQQLSELDQSFNFSLTQPNQANISNAFNYMLPVFGKTDDII